MKVIFFRKLALSFVFFGSLRSVMYASMAAFKKPGGSRRSEFDFPIVDKERTWNVIDVLNPIAKAHGCGVARVSLAWLLAQPVVTSVILGAKRLDQLNDNLASINVKLTVEELKKIGEVSKLPREYPGWMFEVQDIGRREPPTQAVWDNMQQS
jgi:aryl-alcohol dehydrogenase-like predicted oxidoreductase